MYVQVVVLSTVLSTLLASDQFVNVTTLRLVNVVYRHGDRTPVVLYPNYIHNVTDTWPDGLGWLTKLGIKQHYSLGNYLRRRYQGFLSDRYDHTQITIHSSNIERCLMSAYSNLAGMYPPSGTQVWNTNITWQPIPVHTRPLNEDNMLSLDEPCPRYDQIKTVNFNSPQIQKEQNDNKEFYEFLSNKSGLTTSLENVWIIGDTLFCDKQHNVSWPTWVNATVHQTLETLWAWGFEILYGTTEAARLKGGPLLKEWVSLSQRKVNDKSDVMKMNVYSGHDTTVMALLCALGNCHRQILPYTSTVIMEVHEQHQGKFHVELYLRNVSSTDPNDDTEPHQIKIPGCDFQCPLDKFVTLTKDVVPVDWDAECRLGTKQAAPAADKQLDEYRTPFTIAVSVFSVITVLLLGIIVFMSRRKRSSSDVTTETHVFNNDNKY